MSHEKVQNVEKSLSKQFDSLFFVQALVPRTRDICQESLPLDEIPAGAIATAINQPWPLLGQVKTNRQSAYVFFC